MARSKPDLKSQAKKRSVSTSAMFQKADTKAQSRGETKHRKVTRPKSKFHDKANKMARSETAEHPLATAFSNSVEQSRVRLFCQKSAGVETAAESLSLRLSKSNDHYNKMRMQGMTDDDNVIRPIKVHAINWDSADGNQSGVTQLGSIMRTLKRVVTTEEQEITRLHSEWQKVDDEIRLMALKLVGQGGYECRERGTIDAPTFNVDETELYAQIEQEKKHAMEQIEQANLTSMITMKDSEKDLKIKQTKMETSFYDLLRDDDS